MKLFCTLCETEKEVILIGKYKNKNKLFENKQLFQCLNCKFIFIHPAISSQGLDLFYKTIWLHDEKITSTSDDAELTYQIQAKERLRYLSSHIDLSLSIKVLDLGSGYGYLFDAFKNRGLNKISFYATELSPDNLNRLKSKGINVFSDLKEIKERDFDLVTICSVLEHVNEPCRFMRSAMEYVKEGGYIFVEVPERDDTFKPILEPHVCVFTAGSLTDLFEKLGLKIIHITGYGVQRSELISKLNKEGSLLKNINKFFEKINQRIGKICSYDKNRKIKQLYQCYKFDEEGPDRWWIRAILKK
jgi:2-polyprenyl-3-methyl-5-hydroxy-6-metoxy-1,4-benzoquinol methylase